jgi:hypothetical protein
VRKVFRVDHYSTGMCMEYESCTRVLGPDDKTEEQFLENCQTAKEQYVAAQNAHKAKYWEGFPEHLNKYFGKAGKPAPYAGWKENPSADFLRDHDHFPYKQILEIWNKQRAEFLEYTNSVADFNKSFFDYLYKLGYEPIEYIPDDITVTLYWSRGEGIPD